MECLAEALSLRRRSVSCLLSKGPFHAAAIFSRNNSALLAYGENTYYVGDVSNKWTVHAESSAIDRLPTQPRRKRLVSVDMLVIRTSRTGCLGQSRPCVHCIITMCRTLPLRGYKLDRIYYSDENQKIQMIKLHDLVHDEHQHVTMFYKTRRMRNLCI